MKTFVCIAVLAVSILPVSIPAISPTLVPSRRELACADLASQQLRQTTISGVEAITTGAFTPPGSSSAIPDLPPFCRVTGEIRSTNDSHIRFELWLPLQNWNHKFAGVGNVGFGGVLLYDSSPAGVFLDPRAPVPLGYSLSDQLRRGYATAATDTGHQNGDGGDDRASFAFGHPERVTDFAYRSVHEMTLRAKSLVEAFYGRPAEHSYWLGQSTGGRQGLMEAQRFPADYDGIIVAAPPINVTWNWARQVDAGLVTSKDADHNVVTAPALRLLHASVIAACDRADGIADGVLDDPRMCTFDPAALQCAPNQTSDDCLSRGQVESVRQIYGGLKDPTTGAQLNPGLERGSEAFWGQSFGPAGSPHPAAISYFRWVVFGDSNWNWKTFDFSQPRDYQTVLKTDSRWMSLNATDPDLRAFRRRGGKLLHWHGWADQRVEPQSSTNYYESVLKFFTGRRDRSATLRDVQSFYRLFMAPGLAHAFGTGSGPNTFDMETALEQWVEHGIPPSVVVATHSTNGVIDNSRPLCPYPSGAVYKGTGNMNDAASFVCRDR